MGKHEKFRQKLLDGDSDNSIDFDTLCQFLKRLGFSERINGSHHIFYKDDIPEILNIQSKQGKAKAYQVKQIRNAILRYKLKENDTN